MKYIKLLFLSLSFAATFTACDMTDFGDINKDPNEPSEANTGMLFTYACTYVKYFSMNNYNYAPVFLSFLREDERDGGFFMLLNME